MKRLLILSIMLSFFNKSVSQTTPLASIYDIQINQLNGDPLDLSTFKDKYIFYMNTATSPSPN